MEVQLESLDLFILFSHSDLCAIINKEVLITYTMYRFKLTQDFLIWLDLIEFIWLINNFAKLLACGYTP